MAAKFTEAVIHEQVVYQAGDDVPDTVDADLLESLKERGLVEAPKAKKAAAKKEDKGV